jgi:hypothetical protein
MEKIWKLFALFIVAMLSMTISYAQNLDFDEEKPAEEEKPEVKEGAGETEASALQDCIAKFVREAAKAKLGDDYRNNKGKIDKLAAEPDIARDYVLIKDRRYSQKLQRIKIAVIFKADELRKDLACEVVEGESLSDDEENAIAEAKNKAFMRIAEANMEAIPFRDNKKKVQQMADEKSGEYVQVVKKGSLRNGKITIVVQVDWERAQSDLKGKIEVPTKDMAIVIIGDGRPPVVVPPYDVKGVGVEVNRALLSRLTTDALQNKLQKFYEIKSFTSMDEAIAQKKYELAASSIDVRVEKDVINWLLRAEAPLCVRVFVDKVEVQRDPIRNGWSVYINLSLVLTNVISNTTLRVEKSSFDVALKDIDTAKHEYAGGWPTANIGVEQAAREATKVVARLLGNDLLRTVQSTAKLSDYVKVSFQGFPDDEKRSKIEFLIRKLEKQGKWKVRGTINKAGSQVDVNLEYKSGALDAFILETFKELHLKLALSAVGRLVFQPKTEEEF